MSVWIGLGAALVLAAAWILGLLDWQDSNPPSGSGVTHPEAVAAVPDRTAPVTERNEGNVEASAHEDGPDEDWDKLFAAGDHYAFVEAAAAAALDGDGRAAWLMSRALLECTAVLRTEEGALSPAITANPVEMARQKRCSSFRHQPNPLDALELQEEAKRAGYWRQLAEALGDSRAVAYRAERAVSGIEDLDAAGRAQRQQLIMDDVRVAVESKDPQAIFFLGNVYGRELQTRPLQSELWLLASCDLGFDCSVPLPPTDSCGYAGTCEPFVPMEFLRRNLGEKKFAEIYAEAQDVAYRIRVGDWEGLQPFLAMKP
jgi:hypothetical protein